MPKINIEQLRNGMVLAKDVQDRRGRLLLPAGAALNAKHQRYFKMLDIKFIQIEGAEKPADEGAGELDPKALEAAEQAERLRFGETDLNHPLLKGLFEFVVRRRARQLGPRKRG